MPLPIEAEIKQILQPIEGDLVEVVLGGWEDWHAIPDNATYELGRTRANGVWEKIIRRARAKWENDNRFRIIPKGNTCLFVFMAHNEPKVQFRFKKGNTQGMSSNVLTRPELPFPYHDHGRPLTLFPLADVPRIEVVYILNNVETDIIYVSVIGRDNDKIIWRYELPLAAVGVVVPVSSPKDVPTSSAASLVTLKKPAAERKDSEGR